MKRELIVSCSLAALTILCSGCGGGSGSDYEAPTERDDTLYKLSPQGGTQNYLFYGDVNAKSLGSLKNVRVIDSEDPSVVLIENNDTGDVRYPVATTTMQYDRNTKHYNDLHIQKLGYVSKGKAYTISMEKNGTAPVTQPYTKTGRLSGAAYTEIDYLGSRQYLVAHDDDANRTILITPEMAPDDTPVDFGNRKLLSVTFPAFGEAVDGYLVYDNSAKEVQKCTTDMQCSKIDIDAGSRDFEGDIAGTPYALFLTGNRLVKLDKRNGATTQIALGNTKIATGHGTTAMQGGSFYFIGDDANLYRVDLMEEKVVRITQRPDNRIERIRGFTNDYVIFGSDTLLMAAKKNGSTPQPTILAQTTKTTGYKYVTNYGVGDDYLFVTYSVDPKTGHTAYKACIFNEGAPECKAGSFWAGATLKRDGTRNYESSFSYTPYAYIRVDNTDDFGGGTLKAIDPNHPFADGIAMGKIADYNFQTFLTNSRYIGETVDGDGGVVFYAKNDRNFHVDAFYFNLLKEGSLRQLTDEDPFPDVTHGRDHCHGRPCMLCHNLAGGKIYTNKKGSRSAYGYRIRLDFEDGTQLLADIAKGKGENFRMPLKALKGNFKANVLDANGSVVNHSAGFYHEGREAANCNYCHARNGQTRFGAPGVISIEP